MLEVSYGYWIVLTENILKVQAIITALRIADEPEARFWMMSRWQRFQCPALKRCSASRCWSPSLRARVALASWIHCMGMSSLSVRKRSFSADSSVSSRALCWFRISRTARSRSLHIYKTQQIMLSKHTHTHSHYEFLFRLHHKASRLPYRGLVVYSEPFWLATTQPQRTEIKASLLTMSQGCAAEQKQPSPTGPRSRAGQRS